MRALLPGKPRARLQAICTAYWNNTQLIAYVTGNAIVVLDGETILQTIYNDVDTGLEAIAIDEASGKIATCGRDCVHIYRPYGHGERALKWSLQATIADNDRADVASTLSWGAEEELLTGSSHLSFYATQETPTMVWQKDMANTVKFASLSYDSGYIASTGWTDRLVKVWRRLSYGSDEMRFDFTYLSHPQTVTDLRWRRPYHLDQSIDNVLYTIAADNVLRIWAATDPHGLQILQLWAQIDLTESIQPRSPRLTQLEASRFAFIIDGRDFRSATEHLVQQSGGSSNFADHALEHLVEVANRSPEVCVVLDGNGHMSAWGLEDVGCKARKETNIFNIAHVSGLTLNMLHDTGSEYVRIYNYCVQSSGKLKILFHSFNGSIHVCESNIAHLFDPSPRKQRIKELTTWTGHSAAIKKIVRNVSGSAIVSRTDSNEGIVWKHSDGGEGTVLAQRSTIKTDDHIHRICVIRKGNFVIFLHHSSLTLWDCRYGIGRLLATHSYTLAGKPLCILVLPETKNHGHIAHIATISSQMKGIVWEVSLPADDDTPKHLIGQFHTSIADFCTFDLGNAEDLAYVLPVDPAGSAPMNSGFLDTFARDVAISYTHSGLLRSWAAKVNTKDRKVDWLLTCSVETGVSRPSLASGSSIRKAAIVNSNRSELTIWDVRGGRLEFKEDNENQDEIQDLDWTSTPDDQSILAVGFRFRVKLLSQMRYDYLNKGPAWAAVHEINIREMTPHPIGDSTWLSNGNLVIGAGNQLFVYDRTVESTPSLLKNLRLPQHKGMKWDLFEIATRLNGPLPVFHPQLLGQCILAGKILLVQRIILALHKVLRYHVEGERVDNLLGMSLEDFYNEPETRPSDSTRKELSSAFADLSDEEDGDSMTEAVATTMIEKLASVVIPQLSGQEQMQLADVIECVALVEKQRRSMDENAARFMLYFRQHALGKGRTRETGLSWREINWAFHSNSQDILSDMTSQHYHGKILWKDARDSGLFMWLSDSTALKAKFEIIARNEYTKTDMKNPIDCSLYYLALKKKTVLSGLWRMAGWNREQVATLRLLQNNFQDPKWKTVALKNAYALLGKRRFEYAAAFFLLADHLKDAINVCLNQMQDIQLAIAVARVYEGDHGPVLREILEDKILPTAAQEGNRWLASWAFWMLGRKDMAVRALVSPVYTLIESPETPDQQSKLYLTDDPALVVLYAQLRQTTLQTLRGASKVTPKAEWNFVIHNARLYDRMGCDLLALDLVRNWEFLLPTPPLSNGNSDGHPDPRKILRRRSSLVVADLPTPHSGPIKQDGLRKPPPSVFEEPESNSLLDSFGF